MKYEDHKARNWAFILYPENMVDNWEKKIFQLLQLPACYILHDKDHLGTFDIYADPETVYMRKAHVHLFVHANNTTTGRHIARLVSRLSAEGKNCFSTYEPIWSARYMYEYFIHNTKQAQADGKYQYDETERIEGNNFDIGLIEQVSAEEKLIMIQELKDTCIQTCITNYADFYIYVCEEFPREYRTLIDTTASLENSLWKLCGCNFSKMKAIRSRSI